jgi:ABC-type branched-subunit amino acid transport system substrate-binding protein
MLTKPYGLTHADGRTHPPYTEHALELAITRGKDPAGNKLLSVMPRYAMSREDLTNLLAYLKRLDQDRDPGITDSKIVIGTLAPTEGAMDGLGQAVKAVTAAFFDELNSQGGIYGRRFELKYIEAVGPPGAARANIERLFRDEQIFAITGGSIAGSEKELVPLMAQQEIPLIGPLTLYPQIELPMNRQVFYLLPGTDELARALIDFASHNAMLNNRRVIVVRSQSEINTSILAAVKDEIKKDRLSAPLVYDYPPGRFDAATIIGQIGRSGRDAIFFLGDSEEALAFMQEAETLGWFPYMLLPRASGADLFVAPAGFNGKVYLSFPTSPADQSDEGMKEFGALAEKYKFPPHHLAAQILAFSAAKVLVEALTRAGKDLSRENLIQALEGLYEYRTGLTPAITFGPNRRIGAIGAYVVTLDLKKKQFLPVSGWIDLD